MYIKNSFSNILREYYETPCILVNTVYSLAINYLHLYLKGCILEELTMSVPRIGSDYILFEERRGRSEQHDYSKNISTRS